MYTQRVRHSLVNRENPRESLGRPCVHHTLYRHTSDNETLREIQSGRLQFLDDSFYIRTIRHL